MTIKRRGKRQVGPIHRISVRFPKTLYEALSDASEHLGYSISEIARRVIDRGVGAGLIYSTTPHKKGTAVVRVTHFREYADMAQETIRLNEAQIKILADRLTVAHKFTDQQQRLIEEYAEVITEQASDLELLRSRAVDGNEDVQSKRPG